MLYVKEIRNVRYTLHAEVYNCTLSLPVYVSKFLAYITCLLWLFCFCVAIIVLSKVLFLCIACRIVNNEPVCLIAFINQIRQQENKNNQGLVV